VEHKHVLIVEDDGSLRETLAEVLRSEGFDVECAVDGSDALKQLRHQHEPCLVLLDMMMPRVNGWDVIAELERSGRAAQFPIVIMTATPEDLPAGYPVIRKPASLSAITQAVERHCATS
jgi:CheY-like chemotaxis protein